MYTCQRTQGSPSIGLILLTPKATAQPPENLRQQWEQFKARWNK